MLLIFRSSCDVVELSKGLRVLVTSEGENRLAMLWPQLADANMNITHPWIIGPTLGALVFVACR